LQVDPYIIDRLADDLDTPNAITRLRELYKLAQTDPGNVLPTFLSSAYLLGLSGLDKPGYFRSAIAHYAPKSKEQQAHDANVLAIRARTAAANNLPEAVELFDQISARGANVRRTDDGDIQLSFSEKPVGEVVEEMLALRKIARARKDFAESDRIRDELAKMGVVLKDSRDGTTWEIAR
jgi:cysteinyl-tRNA synthetase